MNTRLGKGWWIGLYCLLFVCATTFSQESPKQYTAYHTSQPIVIDGQGTEPFWKAAPWSTPFIDIEGDKEAQYQTQMKMLWDEQHLYFLAELKEPHVWGTLRQRDTVIFYNNDFEIFIDPDGDTHNYYEFEMNALNTVWDLFLTKPYRNGGIVLDAWDIQGVKTAVQIQGSLNDPTDVDEGWSVEVAIPWTVLLEASGSGDIPKDTFWRINFSRVNWTPEIIDGKYDRKKDSNGAYLSEFNWVWSPQYKIDMHRPEHWGYVYFSADEPGSGASFSLPKDEYIKWYLYDVYRNARGAKTNGKRRQTLRPKKKEIWGQSIRPRFTGSRFGWQLWVVSPFSGKTLSIDQEGKFRSR